jgi:hypothetical protein
MSPASLSRPRINRRGLLLANLAFLATSLGLPVARGVALDNSAAGVADATILIIRHAEKPANGTELASAGEARAQAYVNNFQHLNLNGVAFRPDTLIATADSKSRACERLTVEPLSKALGLPLDLRFGNKDIGGLVHALTSEPHGKTVFIAWHHCTLPQLISALGGDPQPLLPDGSWPDNVFDAVDVLRYGHDGKFIPGSERLIHEDFANPPGLISGASS